MRQASALAFSIAWCKQVLCAQSNKRLTDGQHHGLVALRTEDYTDGLIFILINPVLAHIVWVRFHLAGILCA
jgi:hypothetical protein